MAEQVGFIGMGTMGFPMMVHLARANHELLVLDSDPEVLEDACAMRNVNAATNPAEMAANCSVVFSCLPSLEAVEAVYMGDTGICAGGSKGLVTCDCSSVLPSLARRLAAVLAEKGISHVDAPLFGGPPVAQAGNLYIALSGEKDAVDQLLPLATAFSRQARYVGASGSASTIKVMHNGLGLTATVAMAEAVESVRRSGVDLQTFYEVVRDGRGMAASPYFEKMAPLMIAENYEPEAFLAIAGKDSSNAFELTEALGLEAHMMRESAQAFAEARAAGLGRQSVLAVAKIVAGREKGTAGK